MSITLHKALRAPVAALLVASMALPFAAPHQAQADELSDAQATLSAASAELDSINKEYDSLQSQLSSLESQISDTTNKVTEAQQLMLEGRNNLSAAIESQYKSDGSLSLVNIVLSSQSISDFTKNLTYYTSIQRDQAERVAEQKQLRDTFANALEQLDAQRDEQQQLLDAADAKKAEAEKVVSEASAKVSSIQEAQAQLAALQAQAAAMQQQEQQAAAEESASWNTNTDRTPSASTNSGSSSSGGSSSGSGSSAVTDSSTGWKTGVASAYGGSSDSGTPNPGTTATGAVCNDSSMGVAVPMAWPNYRQYLGRAVEIKYGGRTVVATINDCGYMGGGSRSLDLQPGVFKALGFSTCQAWGLRTVSYRIL